MERKVSASLCLDCPLLTKIPEVHEAIVEGKEPKIRAENVAVVSDPRKVRGRVTTIPISQQEERRRRKKPLLSKVFVIFANVTQSNLAGIPPNRTDIEMPTKSLVRSRALVQSWIRRKFTNCSEPKKEGVCPAVKLIGSPRISQISH
jgi:hypothetical protein